MGLSNDLVSQFAKLTKNDETKSEETVYGTIVEYNGNKYVKFDGSDLLTPISSTTNVEADERVTVRIKNHTATVTGNLSSPAARTSEVKEIGDSISEFEIIIADKVDTIEFNAEVARIDELQADNVAIKETLTAKAADITELQADNATIKDTLSANNADITDLKTEYADINGKLTAVDADIESLQADNVVIRESLSAQYADITDLKSDNITVNEKLTANTADIEDLKTEKLSAEDADLRYANIDFSNIGKAAMENFYANSGLIEDVIVGDGTITGHLVGVTISGDLIEGETIVAENLVIKGEDGLYYKLNTDGSSVESEQTDYNSLSGSVIKAKSITASKISVTDLVAFGATIGGFNITDDAIYSGVKEAVGNTTKGIYLDNDGQMAVGDANNFIKFFKDSDGIYKLLISAQEIKLGSSGRNIEQAIQNAEDKANNAVVSTVEEFYLSDSPIDLSGGNWSADRPVWTDGKYIWRRTYVTYGDNSSNYTPSENGVCITGNTGADGNSGAVSSDTAPSDTTILWRDTSVNPPLLKQYNGGKWVVINDIEIGGRNFLVNSKTLDNAATGDNTCTIIEGTDGFNIAAFAYTQTQGMERGLFLLPSLPLSIAYGRTFTFSCMLQSQDWMAIQNGVVGWPVDIRVFGCTDNSTDVTVSKTVFNDPEKGRELFTSDGWHKFYCTFTVGDDNSWFDQGTGETSRFYIAYYNCTEYALQIKQPKLEYGNRATDWTPAPEDSETLMNEKTSNIYQTIEDQTNSILDTTTEFIEDSLGSYVREEEFEEYKTSQASLSVELDNILVKIDTESTKYVEIDGRFEEFKKLVETYFDFREEGLYVGKSDSPFSSMYSNSKISFMQNGIEVAYIQYNKLYILNAHFIEGITIGASTTSGYWGFKADDYGLGIVWIS